MVELYLLFSIRRHGVVLNYAQGQRYLTLRICLKHYRAVTGALKVDGSFPCCTCRWCGVPLVLFATVSLQHLGNSVRGEGLISLWL
jgi:hypothetical protein